ncbi:MAG: hypothetical protein R3D55_28030 [Chloroflexota bacterium]
MQTYLEMALSETNRLTNLVLQLETCIVSGQQQRATAVSLPDIISQVHLMVNTSNKITSAVCV